MKCSNCLRVPKSSTIQTHDPDCDWRDCDPAPTFFSLSHMLRQQPYMCALLLYFLESSHANCSSVFGSRLKNTQHMFKTLNKPKRNFCQRVQPKEHRAIVKSGIFPSFFCVVFLVTSVGVRSIQTTIDNFSQISEALAFNPKSLSLFVSLISIFNFLGRFSLRFLFDYY